MYTHTHPSLLFSCQVVSNSFATPWTVARQAPLSYMHIYTYKHTYVYIHNTHTHTDTHTYIYTPTVVV